MKIFDLMALHQFTSEQLGRLIELSEMELAFSEDAIAYIYVEISSLTEKLSLLATELARSKSQQTSELGTKLHLQNVMYLVQSGEYPIKEAH